MLSKWFSGPEFFQRNQWFEPQRNQWSPPNVFIEVRQHLDICQGMGHIRYEGSVNHALRICIDHVVRIF
jgi:hypothetical protein